MLRPGGVFRSLDGLTDAQIKQIVNFQNEAGLSPLHVAVQRGNFAHVQKLISLGADCSLPDAEGNTPLHLAATSGNLEILNALADTTDDLDLQNNDGETPVILAAHAGNTGAFVSLTSMDKHVVPADTGIVDSRGRNVLMHACISGDMDLVRLILSNREGNSQRLSVSRISPNAEDQDGVTALMHSAMESQWYLVAILVANKANIEYKDHKGRTALHWAASYGDASTVSALLDCGACVDDVDDLQWTPLMHAVTENNLEIAQILLESDANPDHCLGLTRSKSMHVMLSDAVRDAIVNRAFIPRSEKPLILDGRFMVTLLRLEDVYIDPSSVRDGTDPLIVYGVVQWKSSGDPNESEVIGFTEGVAADRLIEWNETVTFFMRDKVVTRDCMLCIDLFATRNHEPISSMFSLEHAAGEDAGDQSDDAEDEQRAKIDEMHKRIQEYERNELPLDGSKKLAKSALKQFHFSDHKRRWNQLTESRKRLSKFRNIEFPVPPVPSSHFPCGSVRISYSRLRELFRPVIDQKPRSAVQLSRAPRFADKGLIHFEIDYIPSVLDRKSLRGELSIPATPKASELGGFELAEKFFDSPDRSAAEVFATRAEKLESQGQKHYLRWWSSLGGGQVSQRAVADGKQRTLRQEEADLVKTIHIIARSMIN